MQVYIVFTRISWWPKLREYIHYKYTIHKQHAMLYYYYAYTSRDIIHDIHDIIVWEPCIHVSTRIYDVMPHIKCSVWIPYPFSSFRISGPSRPRSRSSTQRTTTSVFVSVFLCYIWYNFTIFAIAWCFSCFNNIVAPAIKSDFIAAVY